MRNYLYNIALVTAILLANCQPNTPSNGSGIVPGMVKVAILYPNGEGKTFDMEYYTNTHMPMLSGLFGDALKKIAIDQGISGRTSAEPAPFLAIGYLYFDSVSAYEKSFAPHADKIRGDVPNYTNVVPIVQISEVRQ